MNPNDTQAKISEIELKMRTLESTITSMSQKFETLSEDFSKHGHDGRGTPRVSQSDILPQIRAVGSIEMSTSGRTYKLGLINAPTNILFYGAAIHYASGAYGVGATIDIRSHIVGSAQLGKGFNFQPQSSDSVVTGDILQDIIQSSSAITIGASTVTTVSEFHIATLGYPNNSIFNIAARATVVKFGDTSVDVKVTLQPGWGIVGNFVVS
jgi:hypothetical protein